jgi:hypothetical protein
MKTTITILITCFLAFSVYSQTISFERDTIQVLQDSDAGSVASADVDNDGDMDILITGTSSETGVNTTLYINDGMGTFTASSQPAIVNVYAGAAEFADVDNDGDQDLLITGNTSQTVATANLYLNDGMGNFTLASGTPFEASFGGDIDFGDIDGDGDLDLIMSGKNSLGELFVKLYINNGSDSFSLSNGSSFVPVWFSSTEFIDVDNDNDLDLLICGRDATNTSITTLYLNNGSGVFTAASGTPFTGAHNGKIAFGDTDNDGDQDILITGSNNGQMIAEFYLNNGSSFILVPSTPFPGVSLHSSTFADFNNDGKLDLLHIGTTTAGLIGHIYENTGSNNFILVDSTTIAGSYNGSSVVSDFNGDGKLDIITTGTSFTLPNRAPKIYFNQTAVLSTNESIDEKLVLNVFPNPTNGLINIETNFNSFSDVKIYDLMGRIIFQSRYRESSFGIHLNIPSGVYLLNISNDKLDYNRKIIVE